MISAFREDHLIYLASPYTSTCQYEREIRYKQVTLATLQIFKLGFSIYSPITSWHPIEEMLPENAKLRYENLMQMDLRIICHCNELVVLKLDGWKESSGVEREVTFAQERGIAVTYAYPEDLTQCWKIYQKKMSYILMGSAEHLLRYPSLAHLLSESKKDSTDSEKKWATSPPLPTPSKPRDKSSPSSSIETTISSAEVAALLRA